MGFLYAERSRMRSYVVMVVEKKAGDGGKELREMTESRGPSVGISICPL